MISQAFSGEISKVNELAGEYFQIKRPGPLPGTDTVVDPTAPGQGARP